MKNEDEIMAAWDSRVPMVSICCMTFNHELYIGAAIKSFLMQETDFAYEIIIHDDCSDDATAEIIKEYAAKYPKIIKPILQLKNLYRLDRNLPFSVMCESASGKYIALCEGDDEWLDRLKLSRQLKALENAPNINLCFHSSYCELGDVCFVIGEYKQNIVPVNDIITKAYGQIATSSVFVRTAALERYFLYISDRKWLTVGDIYVLFFSALPGGAIYIDKPMSLYRMMLPGSWTHTTYRSTKKSDEVIKHVSARIRSYEELNYMTSGQYHTAFKQSSLRQLCNFMKIPGISFKSKLFLLNRYKKKFGLYTYLKCILFAIWALKTN